LTAELRNISCVAALDLASFLDVLSKIYSVTEIASRYFGADDCGIIMSTATEAHLYFFKSSLSVAPCPVWSGTTMTDGEGFIKIAEPFDEDGSAETMIFCGEEDLLACTDLSPAVTSLQANLVPLFEKASTILWKMLQILMSDHKKDPASLRIKLEPIYHTDEV
jgi:hypothetical protein